jgi:hypothetical protein
MEIDEAGRFLCVCACFVAQYWGPVLAFLSAGAGIGFGLMAVTGRSPW